MLILENLFTDLSIFVNFPLLEKNSESESVDCNM